MLPPPGSRRDGLEIPPFSLNETGDRDGETDEEDRDEHEEIVNTKISDIGTQEEPGQDTGHRAGAAHESKESFGLTGVEDERGKAPEEYHRHLDDQVRRYRPRSGNRPTGGITPRGGPGR